VAAATVDVRDHARLDVPREVPDVRKVAVADAAARTRRLEDPASREAECNFFLCQCKALRDMAPFILPLQPPSRQPSPGEDEHAAPPAEGGATRRKAKTPTKKLTSARSKNKVQKDKKQSRK
jgi:hypothetical protein